ncbi:MAG: hypothetical protein U0798_15650 [Gemmataceae bacterium]
MQSVFFWTLMTYLAVSTIIAFRRGPKLPARVAILLAVLIAAFPWVRSWLSTEGRSDFHPSGAIANLEWLIIVFGLGPVHLVCMYVILSSRPTSQATPPPGT